MRVFHPIFSVLCVVAVSTLVLLLLFGASATDAATRNNNNRQQSKMTAAEFEHRILRMNRERVESWRRKLTSDKFTPVPVNTTSGPIVGATGEGVTVFLGVPFAAPPLPDTGLRWQPAQPHAPWSTPLDTRWWKNGCVQSSKSQDKIWSPFGGTSEDCLYANVYLPANNTSGKPLPVFFWIYGGSYSIGSSDEWYNPTHAFTKAGAHDQIAVVTINYRLNVFSSLCGSPLQAASKDGSCGTYGISDQRAALAWIRANAANFGLDASRITVGGESAGAGSTGIMLTSPATWGMFAGAIMESGPAAAAWVAKSMSEANETFLEVCKAAGCPTSSSASLACLMAKPWQFFVDHGDKISSAFSSPSSLSKVSPGGFDLTFAPVIDGVVIDQHPAISVKQGRVANVPVLAGTNMNETSLLLPHTFDMTVAQFQAKIAEYFPSPVQQRIFDLYNPASYSDADNTTGAYKALIAVTTDAAMAAPTHATAIATANRTAFSRNLPQTYIYELRTPNWLMNFVAGGRLGVGHMMELPLVWSWDLLMWDKPERELSNMVVEYWYAFVATGNPNSNFKYGSQFKWEPFSFTNSSLGGVDTTFVISLDATTNLPRGDNILNWRRKRFEFWASLGPIP